MAIGERKNDFGRTWFILYGPDRNLSRTPEAVWRNCRSVVCSCLLALHTQYKTVDTQTDRHTYRRTNRQ